MVTSNPNNAFEVTTDHGSIRVLGTSFNIKSTDDHTTVNVKTGKVSVTNLNNDKVFLVKGEGILVSKNKKEIGQPRTLIYDEIDWTDRYLNFDDKSLTHVIGKISSALTRCAPVEPQTATA